MHTPSAQSVPRSLDPDDSVSVAVLQAATAPLREAFGDRVRVEVEHLNRVGPWVFLRGRMRGSDGGRPNFAGTAYESRQADGVVSDVYVALVKKDDATIVDNDARSWRLSDRAIGPTDVAWLTWPDKHEAPPALFGF
ncbi:hypothetical protein [Amycolatopsis nigrescens]|uniref:hypothetical protein n=1 Tax=Amycolatopsis nigrescens TaxID=381445 RepID=UPI0003820651|nr:hypothetical protein [Amycolatopsis nigrescens]